MTTPDAPRAAPTPCSLADPPRRFADRPRRRYRRALAACAPDIARHAAVGLFAFFLAGAAWAQESGLQRVHGVVLDLDDAALAGADVRLTPPGAEAPEVAVMTGDDGSWTAIVSRAARYVIEIDAAGHIPAQGWVTVRPDEPTPEVRVRMRSLAEVSPAFSENPTTVREWLTKGNALLAQGRTSEARGEYEKAVAVLPEAEKPGVFQAIARTHYLEGDSAAALTALERALAVEPSNQGTRDLYLYLSVEAGRGTESEETLARLDREGPSALELPAPAAATGGGGGLPPAIAALGVEPPQAHRRGRYRTAFVEHSPLSTMGIFLQRFQLRPGEVTAHDPAGGAYDLAVESFHVWVPEGYEPGAGYGLFVWISPTPFGGFVGDEMAAALAERKLLWVGADNAGNARDRWYRGNLALDAAHNMLALYDLDPQRVFVGGYSGGGRLTSSMAMLYPEVFHGGFSLYGADYYESLPVTDKPGASWPPRFPEPEPRALARLKADTPFVLLTGELDFNRPQVQEIHRAMVEDGFQHVTLLEIPGASHYTRAGKEWLDRGFAALDGE